MARYSWIDHYQPLRTALGTVAARLREDGWRAAVLADDNALVDRAAAVRAGIGWYGKNSNVLLPGSGSWFVLGSVLTDAPIAPAGDPEPVADGCGPCHRCLTACPTGALVAPGRLDARRCLAWLLQAPGVFPREYRSALGDRLYGCDDCQEVCPVNRLAERLDPAPAAEPGSQASVDVLDLLNSDDTTLMESVGRWYIPRREARYVRRNALIVLGNTADPDDPAVVGAVRNALSDRDPIVRAHAVWAASRLGLADLLDQVEDDAEPLVAAELAHGQGVRRVIPHLLVTNDFPPKVGGIQTYLWELWRRLPPSQVTVLTSPYADSARFDSEQPFRVERTREPVLLPNPVLARRVRSLAVEVGAEAVVLDPAVPLGLIGPHLAMPYAVILHGAEVTIPGRLPASRQLLVRVLRAASLLVSAGGYPAAEARRAERELPPIVQVPPGVDTARFVPLSPIDKASTRARLGLPPAGPFVLSVSRLVPRKGMDVLIESAARLSGRHPNLTVAIAGHGRDRPRLEHLVRRSGAPVRFLGRVPGGDLPGLYACADAFALCCRTRWGGLEQEGFGVVFLEAAAAGVPSVAGRSGGAAEAVLDGETGFVLDDPTDVNSVVEAIDRLISDPALASRQGQAARHRAEAAFSYDVLAGRLQHALDLIRAT